MSGRAPLELFAPRGFPPWVKAGLVARNDGLVGEGPLSFSPGRATSEERARASRSVLAASLGVDPSSLIFPSQVHGARVARVSSGAAPGDADGMVSADPGVVLCLSVADCCAVLVVDPVRRVAGAFHAGWRGARDRIVPEGIRSMLAWHGSRPAELLVWLSPCAGGERYEVGPEVACLFPEAVRDIAGPGGSRLCLDLAVELRRQLVEAGIERRSIESAGVCTISEPRCHSHRRDGERSGRMAAFITFAAGPCPVG